MTIPMAGHPTGYNPAKNAGGPKHREDLVQSAYRFLVADIFPIDRRAVVQFEHGGDNQSRNHYEFVTAN